MPQSIIDYYLSQDPRLVITSDYGWRIHPITGVRTHHDGVDISGVEGGFPTPVPSESYITYVDNVDNSSAGLYVKYKLTSNMEFEVVVMHLQFTSVGQGETVPPMTSIGGMGTTGGSTGNHWHVAVKDSTGSYIDPHTFMVEGEVGVIVDNPVDYDPFFIMLGKRNIKRRR